MPEPGAGNRAPMGDDDALLARLGAAFAPEPATPPVESMAAFERALAERDVRAGARAPRRARRPWWRQPLPVAGLAFGLVLGGGGTALAAGAPLPRPVRALAHDIGLPVDSPQLVDVKKANDRLRDDLQPPTTSPDTSRDAAELARRLSGLDAGERSKVETESNHLLTQVRRDRTGSSDSSQPSAGSSSGSQSESPSGSDGGTRSSGSGSGTSGPASTGSSGSGSGSGSSGGDGGTTATTSSTGSTAPPSSHDGDSGGTSGGSGGGGTSGGSDGGGGSGGSGSGSDGSSGSRG